MILINVNILNNHANKLAIFATIKKDAPKGMKN